MNRASLGFALPQLQLFKDKLLDWSQQFETVAWLDSNACPQLYPEFDAILAVGAATRIETGTSGAFDRFRAYRASVNDWIFGYFSYDLKNDIEALTSENPDEVAFPDMYFFQPEKIIFIKGHTATFSYLPEVSGTIENDYREIAKTQLSRNEADQSPLTITARLQQNDYTERVHNILSHIRRGDIYEANLCQEFYAEAAIISPLDTYKKLNALSRAPFSAFLRFCDHYLLCASPERYLRKTGTTVIAQPIKGTARRSPDPRKDEALKSALENSPK
ncbi:MAG: chorismate-binding protein, partial [Sinomicrobium sp.]|nr:chorismate-binding protein [Sinomicrobium sp.]